MVHVQTLEKYAAQTGGRGRAGGQKYVSTLSKRCPSTIQALSKQVHFLSKLGNGACPNLCVYADLEVREIRPSALFIILKAKRTEKHTPICERTQVF